MDINHLRYFLAMAKHQNLTRASEELLVAQPALSVCLTRMEEHLGVALFDRNKKRLTLNSYGAAFREKADRIVKEYDAAICQLQEMKHINDHTLNIGVADWGFPQDLLAQFALLHPEIHVNISHCYVRDAGNLLNGSWDVLIAPLPLKLSSCRTIPLRKSQVFAVLSRKHRYFDRSSLSLDDLNGEFIWLPGFTSHFGWYIQTLLTDKGVQPEQIQGCMSAALPQLLGKKDTLALVVSEMLNRIPGGLPDFLRTIPFSPEILRDSGIIYHEQKSATDMIRCFHDFMIRQNHNL